MKKLYLVGFLLIAFFAYGYTQSCNLNCGNNLNVSLQPNGCTLNLVAEDLLNNPSPISASCGGYKLAIQYPFGTNTFSPAVKLDASHQGYQVTYRVYDTVANNYCWGTFKVNYCNPCAIPTPPVLDSIRVSNGPYPTGVAITIKVYAHDDKAIQKVEFYNWGDLIATDYSAPYQTVFNTKSTIATENHFWAIVYDECGDKDTSEMIIITTKFPTCYDGIKNGDETGVDCGGSTCAPCHSSPPGLLLPDLIPINVWPVPSTLNTNSWYPFDGKVLNQGTASSPVTKLTVVLSTDNVFSANDISLGTVPISALGVNGMTPFNLNLYIPNIYPGSYYLIACVDPWYDILESNHANNCYVQYLNVGSTPPPPPHHYDPDLTTSYLQLSRDHIYQGDDFDVAFMVNNIGSGSSGSNNAAIFLSSNSTWDNGDLPLKEFTVPPLTPGENILLQSTIHQPIPAGNYYIIVCADHKYKVNESNEYNNCSSIALSVSDSYHHADPDLSVSYLSLNKNPVPAGDPFGIAFMVNNLGDAASPSNYTSIYLSNNSTYDNADTKLTSLYLPGIPAHQNVLAETGLLATMAPGNYYLVVCADDHQQVIESNETNNCSSIAIRISPKEIPRCDLVIEHFNVPGSWNLHQMQSIHVRVRNAGLIASSASTLGSIHIAKDSAGTGLAEIANLHIPALNVNEYVDTLINFTPNESAWEGIMYVSLNVDPTNKIEESNESNNYLLQQTSITIPYLDLKNITAISFSKSIVRGDTFEIPFAMTNLGAIASDTVVTEYYLSYKPLIKFSDAIRVKLDTINESIQQGDTLKKRLRIKLPTYVTAGSYYLNICIDYYNKLKEKTKTNNCQTIRFLVSNPPDPIISTNGSEINGLLSSRSKFNLADVVVYPNPATDKVIFSADWGLITESQVSVFDMSGKELFVNKMNDSTLNLDKLAAGIYILRLQVGKDRRVFRIVKE
ncbi:MAG: CARDB domain-containing protein [Saprospiraceae bacterium]